MPSAYVPSVEPESTTISWSAQATEGRHLRYVGFLIHREDHDADRDATRRRFVAGTVRAETKFVIAVTQVASRSSYLDRMAPDLGSGPRTRAV